MNNVEKKIEEGNKLIAEFMELSVSTLGGRLVWYDWDGAADVEYHTRWDWLMPVVEKIIDDGDLADINIDSDRVFLHPTIKDTFSFKSFQNKDYGGKINAVWEAVTFFLKWYNKRI